MKSILNRYIFPLLYLLVAGAMVVIAPQLRSHKSAEQPPAEVAEYELLAAEECEISVYDLLFRSVGEKYHIDWRLLSAIACAESRFCNEAVSNCGAIGLMQIMPHVADDYGYTKDDLFNPLHNIEVAAQLLKSIERMLHLPRAAGERDRMAMTLACYNCGYSHIADARNLASFYGDNDLLWEDVAEYLELLSDEDFYNHEAVSAGKFSDFRQTVGFVEKVLRNYDTYRRIGSSLPAPRKDVP